MASLREIVSVIRKVVEPLAVNLRLIVSRAVLDAVDDSKGIQVVKLSLLAGEVKEVERMQNFGFTSVPPVDSEGVTVFVGGDREHGICLALDHREKRLKNLTVGQSALYDESGAKIWLKNDGSIDIQASNDTKIQLKNNGTIDLVTQSKVNVLAPMVDLGSGTKEPVLNGQTFQTGYNTHVHTAFGVPTTPVTIPSPPTDLSLAVQAAKT